MNYLTWSDFFFIHKCFLIELLCFQKLSHIEAYRLQKIFDKDIPTGNTISNKILKFLCEISLAL